MTTRGKKEKEKEKEKNLHGGSSRVNNEPDDGKSRCPVPFIPCARRGERIPCVEEGGVMMKCTNQKCQAVSQPVHPECFELLETNLIKILGTLGSARGWTEAQKRNNLWEKKGHSLIAKFVRCQCGLGQCSRDTMMSEEKERATVEKDAKKKKNKKKKELPRLNYGNYATASTNTASVTHVDFPDLYKQPMSSPSELPDSGISSAQGSHSPSPLAPSHNAWFTNRPTPLSQCGQRSTSPNKGADSDSQQDIYDDEDYPPLGSSCSDLTKKRKEMEPARLYQYAASEFPTISHKTAQRTTKEELKQDEDSTALRTEGMADDSSLISSAVRDSHHGIRQFIRVARQDQEGSILVHHPHEVNQVRDPHYTLFGPTSSNFLIGERLLANLHLPACRERSDCLPSRRTERR